LKGGVAMSFNKSSSSKYKDHTAWYSMQTWRGIWTD